jgi:hypothetical protein
LVAGEGKRRGGCGVFCNRRDARVRVQVAMQLATPQGFPLLS